jgi:hypothetical protein
MVLSSFLVTSIQSGWEIEQKNRCILKCISLIFFQNVLVLFKCGISPLSFAPAVSIFRATVRTLSLAERNLGHGGYVV